MHIMVVPSWYSSKYNEVHGSFFKEQFEALKKSGEKITVAYNEILPVTKILSDNQKKGIISEVEDDLDTYRFRNYNFLPKNPNMFRVFNKRMEKLYLKICKERGTVDIIHAHSAFWGGISAAYVAKKYNIPFVLTEHSSLKYSVYYKKSYYKWVKYAYDSADRLISVGNDLKKEMQNYTDNKIIVVPNLIDLEMFAPKKEKARNNKFTFFSLAYLVEGKGMERLIKAFSEVFKGQKVVLNIGGDGPLKQELIELSQNLGVSKQINFLGLLTRKQVTDCVNNCDAFVLASEHESFGVVYIEAMAVGKPVLGTKNGGAEDIINHKNGVIVENKNHKALTEGLIQIYNNVKANKYNSHDIRLECINKYSEKAIIGRLKSIYKEIKK